MCLLGLLEEALVVGKVHPITTTFDMEVNFQNADVVLGKIKPGLCCLLDLFVVRVL